MIEKHLDPQLKRVRLATLTFGIPLLFTVAGCRLGNNIERADTSGATSDPITGYYAAQPQSLVYCAETTVTNCQSASVNEVPTDIRATMTNPVILYLADSTGAGLLLPNDGSDYGISTAFKSLSEIESLAESSTDTLWLDPACTRTAYLQQVGTFSKNSSQLTESSPGSLSLTFTYYELFEGTCGPTFEQIYACANDAAQCAEDPSNPTETTQELNSLQAAAENFLSPYLNSGALSPTDFSQLRSFAFEVVYE